ncbi:MAG: glycosyl hydrolase [Bacteroidota bacterium]
MRCNQLHFFLLAFLFPLFADAQAPSNWSAEQFKGLEFRSIGPAFMSGRIADVAIHPQDDNTWYVAVGSGGVWKTKNAGTTWKALFDDQVSYSIGCIAIDPSNPHTVWVGTGENVGGRHVGFGDGIYRSQDGGHHWQHMGLKASEHISKIIVHPNNSDVIWVAVQGPLWSKGGERGIYKSTDGGQNWRRVLGDAEWTGATDILVDPRNPDVLYAATWQRHRTVAAYMGGGPGSGIHRSTDGGENWTLLQEGLPKSNMGKIGLAISPQRPDVIYAAIELNQRKGGVYRSTDRGASWEKRSDAVAGATGPHYYQELYACPHQFDRLYLVDVRMQISDDGGKKFRRMKEKYKHSDNHAIAFRKDDPDYLLVGTDGGLYESFDLAENWRFIDNLPITQFYKVALDDREPFYHVYGGTQDNNTQGGPSRTDNVHGIQNSDWRVVLNWDGHQPATEPGNPDIMYAERQEGNLSRIDLKTGEVIDIQPQPAEGENYERFNWDAPILVSPHSPTRIYFASQRVWKSDNRGDDWTAISNDLTRNQQRMELPIMGRRQSADNAWDLLAMSNYNTITSLAESPKQAGLLYAGTDDGLIQISENGGESWRKLEVGRLPGVPATAFVNDIKADLYDASTVYVALDNHKYGDYKPYLFKSTDKGKSWKSIGGNLPERTLVWRLVQDHVKAQLLFAATEFGIYFSTNGGERWTQLKGGVPTISFRDLAIQRRENDLVGASFGRGFYILDDYSALRDLSDEQLQEEASLFPLRKAWWYMQRPHLSFDGPRGSQGASHFVAPNPPFGAVFTYYLKEGYVSGADQRKKAEKELNQADKDVPFPGWDALEDEMQQDPPRVWLIVKDQQGQVVRRLEGPSKAGFHRVAWDLRHPDFRTVELKTLKKRDQGEEQERSGLMAAPGTYTVGLYKQIDGNLTALSQPQSFEVVPLHKGSLPGAPMNEVAAFWRSFEDASQTHASLSTVLKKSLQKTKGMQRALKNSQAATGTMDKRLYDIRQDLFALNRHLNGNGLKDQVGEKDKPTVGNRLFAVNKGITHSTYGPTQFHKESLRIAKDDLSKIQNKLNQQLALVSELERDMVQAGAPWVEGESLPGY